MINPESTFKFDLLKDCTPQFRNVPSKDFVPKNYEKISQSLKNDGGPKLGITSNIVKRYAKNLPNPGIILVKHAKILCFTNSRAETVPNKKLVDQVENETPLFFVHPDIAGSPMSCYGLVTSYNLYSICLQQTINTPTTSLKDMAAYYTNTIIGVQPKGPYKLVGQFYGASLAYEIAYQLIEKGHHIKLLAMVNDSPVHECRPPLFDPRGKPLEGSFLDPAVFFNVMLELDFPTGALQLPPDKSNLECVVDLMLETYPWIFLSKEQLTNLYVNLYRRMKCLWEYQPKPILSSIDNCLLIRDKVHPFFVSKDFGLSKLVSNPTIVMCKIGSLTPGSDESEDIMTRIKQYL